MRLYSCVLYLCRVLNRTIKWDIPDLHATVLPPWHPPEINVFWVNLTTVLLNCWLTHFAVRQGCIYVSMVFCSLWMITSLKPFSSIKINLNHFYAPCYQSGAPIHLCDTNISWRLRLQKVTRIIGAEIFLLNAAPLASHLQKQFACAAHANPLPGAKANGACEIVMQGDVATRVRSHVQYVHFILYVIYPYIPDELGISLS